MRRLTIILVNSSIELKKYNRDIEIISSNRKDLKDDIIRAKGKYIAFICNEDYISEDYLKIIYKKTKEEFDCCYINSKINYKLPREIKRNNTLEYLSGLKPYYLEYIWNFMFKKSKLTKILNIEQNWEFNENIDKLIKKRTAITDIIYYHNPDNDELIIDDVPYIEYKEKSYFKNIIYIKDTLTALFNGVITWAMNLGKCYGEEFELTILYDEIYDETKEKLSKYFNMEHRKKCVNYFCDRFVGTYLDYEIPNNVFYKEESSTFVHGLMDGGEYDYLEPDLFDRYIGVSETCKSTIKLNFKTKVKPECIYNPIKINKDEIMPHLRLVSTLRSEKDKGINRLRMVAKILDDNNIPYTWNVFTDEKEGTNHSGFIYRNSVFNALSYVKDSDYLVLLSNSEAYCYSLVEALKLNVKVVVTPLDVCKEFGIKDGENGFIIPFEYFEKRNKDKLVDKVLEIYNNKNKKVKNKLEINSDKFKELFKK